MAVSPGNIYIYLLVLVVDNTNLVLLLFGWRWDIVWRMASNEWGDIVFDVVPTIR